MTGRPEPCVGLCYQMKLMKQKQKQKQDSKKKLEVKEVIARPVKISRTHKSGDDVGEWIRNHFDLPKQFLSHG